MDRASELGHVIWEYGDLSGLTRNWTDSTGRR